MAKKQQQPGQQRQQRPLHAVEDDEASSSSSLFSVAESDEEIDEDGAFNSDDEKKYGSFFADNDRDDEFSFSSDLDDPDLERNGDNDKEGDGGAYMISLIDRMESGGDSADRSEASLSQQRDLARRYGRAGEGNIVEGGAISMDDLLNPLSDTRGFKSTEKMVRDTSVDGATTTLAPVSAVATERAARVVQYAVSRDEAGRYQPSVTVNRESETLDLRVKGQDGSGGRGNAVATVSAWAEKFAPENEFESRMAIALEGQAQKQKQNKQQKKRDYDHGNSSSGSSSSEKEEDDLGRNRLTLEEYRKRHAELAKMRSLLFQEERKRHQLNKIKSKTYRKIRKKQRLRRQKFESDDEDGDGGEKSKRKEVAEIERAKERMTLQHKNTSRWAKRVLRRGSKNHSETLRSLSEQVARGDELRRKIAGENSDGTSFSDNDEDGKNYREEILALQGDGKLMKEEYQGKGAELFKLEFMRKGAERERERAKTEAAETLKELEAAEKEVATSSSEDEEGAENGENDVVILKKEKKDTVMNKKEVNSLLASGEGETDKSKKKAGNRKLLVVGALEFAGKGRNTTVLSSRAVSMASSGVGGEKNGSETTSCLSSSSQFKGMHAVEKEKKTSISLVSSALATDTGAANNPWLENGGVSSKKKIRNNSPGAKAVNIRHTTEILIPEKAAGEDIISTSPNGVIKDRKSNTDTKTQKVTELSQEELMQQAFSGPSKLEVEEEFQKEKDIESMSKSHLGVDGSPSAAPGWGSWAGEGVPPPRRHYHPTTPPPPSFTNKRQSCVSSIKNVIISERRQKHLAKHQVPSVPFPFTSAQQYEKTKMAGPIGKEWNVTNAVRDMTRPEILVRAGKIIKPMDMRAKARRAKMKERAPLKS